MTSLSRAVRAMSRSAPRSVAPLVSLVLASAPALASQPRVHSVDGYADFAAGELEGTSLGGDGVVRVGPAISKWATDLPGPALAVVRGGDGAVYAATANPGRVWRVTAGKKPELVVDLKKPLITALLVTGPRELVALSAPDGGAHFIDLGGKKAPRVVEAKGVKALLGGAALDGTVYAVGGGDEGVLLRLPAGAAAFETLATVKETYLRSVAARGTRAGPVVVAGGADEGVVYRWEKDRLRALVDAAPSEVTALSISERGDVFAALVDADGKLSQGATDRDKDDDEAARKKAKPRKVKSSEVLRLGRDGRVEVLFQSKAHGAYALALVDGERRLLVGTGAQGRIYDLDPEGKRAGGVLASTHGHDEVVALAPDKQAGLLVGTAHAGGVFAVSSTPAKQGVYLSPALDASALARFGMIHTKRRLPEGAQVRVQLRTGNTKTPDETWSPFSPALVADGVANAPPGRYAQLRFELSRSGREGPELFGARLSYLVDNRPPEVARVEVLAPGWKVVASQREPSESRSVTFNQDPFKRYLDRGGGRLPELDERPGGKQTPSPGWRTVYAWVEDPDNDALRYRFFLGRVDGRGAVERWELVKDWSEEPFYSYQASRLGDGEYRVRVEADDLLTNGPLRALADDGLSPVFKVAHARPRFVEARATKTRDGYRVRFSVESALPLAAVRCSAGGDEWIPLDAADGIVDAAKERFDVGLPGRELFASVSCEAVDEGMNESRVDLVVTK